MLDSFIDSDESSWSEGETIDLVSEHEASHSKVYNFSGNDTWSNTLDHTENPLRESSSVKPLTDNEASKDGRFVLRGPTRQLTKAQLEFEAAWQSLPPNVKSSLESCVPKTPVRAENPRKLTRLKPSKCNKDSVRCEVKSVPCSKRELKENGGQRCPLKNRSVSDKPARRITTCVLAQLAKEQTQPASRVCRSRREMNTKTPDRMTCTKEQNSFSDVREEKKRTTLCGKGGNPNSTKAPEPKILPSLPLVRCVEPRKSLERSKTRTENVLETSCCTPRHKTESHQTNVWKEHFKGLKSSTRMKAEAVLIDLTNNDTEKENTESLAAKKRPRCNDDSEIPAEKRRRWKSGAAEQSKKANFTPKNQKHNLVVVGGKDSGVAEFDKIFRQSTSAKLRPDSPTSTAMINKLFGKVARVHHQEVQSNLSVGISQGTKALTKQTARTTEQVPEESTLDRSFCVIDPADSSIFSTRSGHAEPAAKRPSQMTDGTNEEASLGEIFEVKDSQRRTKRDPTERRTRHKHSRSKQSEGESGAVFEGNPIARRRTEVPCVTLQSTERGCGGAPATGDEHYSHFYSLTPHETARFGKRTSTDESVRTRTTAEDSLVLETKRNASHTVTSKITQVECLAKSGNAESEQFEHLEETQKTKMPLRVGGTRREKMVLHKPEVTFRAPQHSGTQLKAVRGSGAKSRPSGFEPCTFRRPLTTCSRDLSDPGTILSPSSAVRTRGTASVKVGTPRKQPISRCSK